MVPLHYLDFARRLNIGVLTHARRIKDDGSIADFDISKLKKLFKSENIKGLIIIPYDNPTGDFIEQPLLEQIAKLCVEYGIWLISDEAYRPLYYDEKIGFSSIRLLDENTVPGITGSRIGIESSSKIWNACGLRIGAILTDNLAFHEKAISEYDANCSRIVDPNVIVERTNLAPLIELGAKKFQEHAFQWDLIDYQKKVEVEILGIKFTGYTDFHFEDKNTKEDFYIDLKTSKTMPSKISMSHAMQQSIYQRATNARQMLWYLKNPTKTKDAEFFSLELDDYQKPMKVCEHILLAMGNYLESVNSPEDVRDSLIPNPDNWIWKEETVYKARKEIWGY